MAGPNIIFIQKNEEQIINCTIYEESTGSKVSLESYGIGINPHS
jgi:hypothetical protein